MSLQLPACDRYESIAGHVRKVRNSHVPAEVETVGTRSAHLRDNVYGAQITKLFQGNGYLLAISSSDTSSSTVSSSTSSALFLAFI